MQKDGFGRLLLLHVAALSTAGAVAAAAVLRRWHRRKMGKGRLPLPAMPEIPRLERDDSGRIQHLEKFSHYVARQIGFEDINECPELCKLANNYLKKTKNCMDDIYDFFANVPDAESLYVKLVEELDKCILGYFAFHWDLSTTFISQHLLERDAKAWIDPSLTIFGGSESKVDVDTRLTMHIDIIQLIDLPTAITSPSIMYMQALTVDSATKKKLRNLVLEATRKQRFERVTRDLKVTRVFSTLVEEMKAIGIYTGMNGDDEAHCTDVMAPVAHCDRSPVLLLMGGGMGAGKSTVLKEILEEPFWSEAGGSAVVVEADAFKETDVIYRAISSMGHHNDMLQTAELVHQSSLKAASSLLVTALNEGRDVILDGTLSWEPYVEQTVAMARAVHRQRYRMGDGYKVDDDGTITEDYWEPIPGDEEPDRNCTEAPRKPYRIEVVGVVCDAYLAVARGIRRAIITGRAVGVKSQLMSHKRFAAAFQKYCHLVDGARLYSTNSMGSAQLIAWKDGNSSLLVEPNEIGCLEKVSNLNENANSVHDLYPGGATTCGSRSVWDDMVVSPSRDTIQRELREAIRYMKPMVTPTAS